MRVLVAIDGSAPAAQALDLVAHTAWPDGTTIRVAEAIESGAGSFGGPWPSVAMIETDTLDNDLRAEAERNVLHGRTGLARPGLTIESAVLRGRASSAIVGEANAMPADLIVVGSRGHGTIESMLLGSVSIEVIDHSPIPVLVARGHGIERVVLAWDGSSCAARAADLVCHWPIFGRAEIHVLAVAEITVPWWTGFPEPGSPELMPMYLEAANASRRERNELADEMTRRLEAAGLRVEEDHREGDAATQIIAAAREWPADMIVLGTHGRTGLARLVIGAVARNVLHHAPCSVLIVPERAQDPAEAR
ncbi:MAG TPA: universal stress protein [Candidatus Limnocylindrales bacterium]